MKVYQDSMAVKLTLCSYKDVATSSDLVFVKCRYMKRHEIVWKLQILKILLIPYVFNIKLMAKNYRNFQNTLHIVCNIQPEKRNQFLVTILLTLPSRLIISCNSNVSLHCNNSITTLPNDTLVFRGTITLLLTNLIKLMVWYSGNLKVNEIS